jgi:DNA polymerase III epsilon subunit-like protein
VRALAELDVLIVDCQTTGASPAFGCVLELGWGVARANRDELVEAQAHWIALPDGERVPPQVQKITGYEPACAAEALGDRQAWQRLRHSMRLAPLAPTAIHYARFELPFLRDWSARFEPDAAFPFDAVCVHAIATRLYPDLPRQSLRALAGYLGHGLDLARRSLGHVEATAFVWRKLCAELGSRGILHWEQLQVWLSERAEPKARPKKNKYPIASERYKQLPEQPGVYRLLRSNGDVLYVGKAANLKKRVTSHFTARVSKLIQPEMLTQVSAVQVTVLPSALEAALLEIETIQQSRPPYNVQLLSADPRVWYATRDFSASSAEPSAAHSVGPVASEYSMRPLAALIQLIAGAAVTPLLRAQAVGVSDLWTPDEAVFAAGWAELLGRHPEELSGGLGSPRLNALKLARNLLLSAPSKEDSEAEKPEGWDAERVARHIERAAARAYQSYRRARWLKLLHDCDISYREPEAATAYELKIRGGLLLSAPGCITPHSGTAAQLDRAKYDWLRVLTSELKRIARDGGEVSVRLVGGRRIPERLLRGVLRLV